MNSYTEFMRNEARSALSVDDAVALLRRELRVRTVREVLESACGLSGCSDGELQALLLEKLMRTAPGANSESVKRNLRNWMRESAQTVSKENAIQLCFALELSVPQAEELLYRLCGEGFHWRDARELVFLYALRMRLSYAHALALYERLKAQDLLPRGKNEQTEVLTGEVRLRVEEISSDAELETFFRENRHLLGKLHNTAYALMTDFLSLLRQPGEDDRLIMADGSDAEAFRDSLRKKDGGLLTDAYTDGDGGDDYEQERHFISAEEMSNREILSTYLLDKLVGSAASDREAQIVALSFGFIENEIRRTWPEETGFSRIVNRKADVTRKLLILLFLATDGDTSDYADYYELDELPEDSFEDRNDRLDAMLRDCGFCPLDPRAPFDWMILFCLCAEDILDIDERLRAFLSALFTS